MRQLQPTPKGNYTFRVDNRTYVIRVYRGHESEPYQVLGDNRIRYRKTWSTQVSYIAAGGGPIMKGATRHV